MPLPERRWCWINNCRLQALYYCPTGFHGNERGPFRCREHDCECGGVKKIWPEMPPIYMQKINQIRKEIFKKGIVKCHI